MRLADAFGKEETIAVRYSEIMDLARQQERLHILQNAIMAEVDRETIIKIITGKSPELMEMEKRYQEKCEQAQALHEDLNKAEADNEKLSADNEKLTSDLEKARFDIEKAEKIISDLNQKFLQLEQEKAGPVQEVPEEKAPEQPADKAKPKAAAKSPAPPPREIRDTEKAAGHRKNQSPEESGMDIAEHCRRDGMQCADDRECAEKRGE